MILMTIKDFRARPCAIEYMTLYLSCSCLLITLAAASFGQLQPLWGITNVLFIAFSIIFLGSCRIKRHARAKQFYTDWLQNLSHADFVELVYRLKHHSKEYRLVRSMQPQCNPKRSTMA